MVYIREFSLLSEKGSFCDITASVKETIKDSGIRNGIAVVEAAHSTASVLKIAEYDEGIVEDIVREMRRMIPARINFTHQSSPEDSAGHIKSALFGSSLSLIVKDGELICDNKQSICFADYDGPRNRNYSVCVYGT